MIDDRPIAVLGGGHGAHAMAADLTLRGHRVRLCEHPEFEGAFRPTLHGGAIELRGLGPTGRAEPELVTTDFGAALEGVGLVNLAIPAFGQELFFEAMLPHLGPDHVVAVWAGDFGSLRLAKLLSGRAESERPLILEGSTLPYGARLSGPARVDLLLRANRVLVAGLPASRTEEVLEPLRALWPMIEPAENVLQAALGNPNPLVHPPGALLSTGRIEYTGGDFYMYREGMTPAIKRVIREAFLESSEVAEALGFEIPGYPAEDFQKPASIMGEVFEGPEDHYEVIAGIIGPKSLDDRYLTEDLPYGLLPVSQLGDVLGVDTPTLDGIIQLGSIVCERDFRVTGRTLETLGLAGLSAPEIMARVAGRAAVA